ncbi:hypothetical protein [Inhella sp.]|uniref:hypothetical protein n=1 Tax=Inhella sp. TaxID=1921806 RepID=UPI0035B1CFDE
MNQSITAPVTAYLGLDVHKDRINIAVAQAGRDAEVRHLGTIGGDQAAQGKALRRLISAGQRLHIGYEAGPCGFVIYRHLSAQGLHCEVVAPSSITKRAGDRVNPLQAQLRQADAAQQRGGVALPHARVRKYRRSGVSRPDVGTASCG